MGFFNWLSVHRHLVSMEDNILSVIGDFANVVKAHHEVIKAGLLGVRGDIDGLKARIEELLQSETITEADKAALAEILADAGSIADSITTLDAENPPPAPPA